MSKNWNGFKKHCFEIFTREQEVKTKTAMKPMKKLIRNSEYSKSDNFKKFSVLAQILSFW